MIDLSRHARSAVCALGTAVIAALMAATAALPARAQHAPLPDKPFAEHRIALQLSDNDPRKQGLVISVANNLPEILRSRQGGHRGGGLRSGDRPAAPGQWQP